MSVSLIDGHIDGDAPRVTLEETVGYFKDMVDGCGAYELCPCGKDDMEMTIIALSALEKQIPKKPLPIRDVRSGRIVSFTCPNCSHTDLGNNEFRFKCCEDCGQALDWSDTE